MASCISASPPPSTLHCSFNQVKPSPPCPWQAMHSPTHRIDSWVEIGSTASSSSASIAPNSSRLRPISPTHDANPRARRRRLLRNAVSGPTPTLTSGPTDPQVVFTAETSSQEEYEESESESDRVLTSSNENLNIFRGSDVDGISPSSGATSSGPDTKSSASEGEENGTALGIGTDRSRHYTPPANAFTHPPSHLSSRRASHSAQTTQTHPALIEQRRYSSTSTARPYRSSRSPHNRSDTYPSRRGTHSPYSALAPTHRIDHDAVLRASLSTLLSCAAAVRGQPKSNTNTNAEPGPAPQNRHTTTANTVQPSTLRLVPDSGLRAARTDPPTTSTTSPTADLPAHSAPTNNKTDANQPPKPPSKRKASPSPSTKDRSSAPITSKSKKPRALSPTPANLPRSSSSSSTITNPRLLSFVLSASVVVILSALSFSAGYVLGRDTGRLEALRAAEIQEVGVRALGRGGRGLRRGLVRV